MVTKEQPSQKQQLDESQHNLLPSSATADASVTVVVVVDDDDDNEDKVRT